MNITDLTPAQRKAAEALRTIANGEGGTTAWTTIAVLRGMASVNTPTMVRVIDAAKHGGITFEDGTILRGIDCDDVSVARGDDWLGHVPGVKLSVAETPTIGVNVRTGALVY